MASTKKSAKTKDEKVDPTEAKPLKPAHPFGWWNSAVSAFAQARFLSRNADLRKRAITERASLLRRLGYGRDEVLLRLSSYEHWEYEPFHKSPVASEVEKLVDAVFAPAKARATALEP
ncbi:MAG TPA: hypothetical protein PKE31_03625 [Pseudomonadota bacterium]|nr:hypothetical protein [Pseudomonadota bacterium]